ncbi:cytochrome P450 4C1 [Asbolus verrucosus]|uniref:Cytochrome P450 4C1 n=1 Tax=Asbolus verrucosus TaxID=1661398 RepID=A0A482VRW8_ASBVE|nr:cytochrome P450 4C1 [Asbolus verrucosus]
MYIPILLACVFLFWYVQFHWKRRRLYQLSRKIPGPLTLPFIGNAYLLRGDAPALARNLLAMFDRYPELSKYWIGKDLYYIVTKPEYLEIILNSPSTYEKVDLYKYVKPMVGDGLISAPVKIWKRHRKIIAPSLNQKILNEYTENICEQCNILIELLQKQCGKGEIDHCRYLTNCAVDIICETIFGVPINAQVTNETYSHIFDRLLEIMFLRIGRVLYHFDFIFCWTKEYEDQKKIIKKIKDLSLYIIEKKKEQLESQVAIEEEKKKPFLDLIMEKHLNNEFSREELEDEINTFLLAGSDTNATSSSFVLTLLGMHQDIQQKLYEEVVEILGPDRDVKLEDLPNLKYTELVIKESLRIFPGAPFIGRIVEEDIVLDDKITIPKGCNVVMGYLHMHRCEKYWSNPLEFDPDRFLPENSLHRHPYSWLPFSGGPRNCIGIKYGMMVMKIMIAMLIRRFKVTSSVKKIEDIELTANVVLKPRTGFRLAFELR